ncbi:hypothetical protein P7K49_037398 [Saguinus oedipus]|uniref:Phosphomevalonate kinase n=1 Tax=Saguinus oedipus TaxID=9490 RepID=A0ABQ9THX4_SAGOE|nr:hypothetical protein P7K49_037398 [Saguinus oedipus]
MDQLRGSGGCGLLNLPLQCFRGVDDAESECGLDNFGDFDWVIENHGDEQRLEEQLETLTEFIRARL